LNYAHLVSLFLLSRLISSPLTSLFPFLFPLISTPRIYSHLIPLSFALASLQAIDFKAEIDKRCKSIVSAILSRMGFIPRSIGTHYALCMIVCAVAHSLRVVASHPFL
jgi:hypothetical protein